MKTLAVAIVLLGFALTAGLAIAGGLDTTGAVILVLVFAVGVLGIEVARRSGAGVVKPAECPACGGLVSPTAPYCKHCGKEMTGAA